MKARLGDDCRIAVVHDALECPKKTPFKYHSGASPRAAMTLDTKRESHKGTVRVAFMSELRPRA